MKDEGTRRRGGRSALGALLALAAFAGLATALAAVRPDALSAATGARAGVPTAQVVRKPFLSTVVASGRVESAQSTEIRCNLARLSSGLTSTILAMIDGGTTVKKGDVLAELDASGYVEMVRRQQIVVDQARATHQRAQLTLEVAQINLEAQTLGVMKQTDKQMRGQIALAESDFNRQEDRLAWTRRMTDKGYVSTGQVLTEEQTLKRAQLTLKQARTALANYERFTAPKQLRSLESAINGATAALEFESIRLKREEERLALYERMVEECVVRAPHDGFVVLANRSGREQEVYVGATVRERMRLFQLPDLSQMEVEVLLHETVVTDIGPGMPVRVRVEALPGRSFEGVVKSVAPLPYAERQRGGDGGSQVTYFVGKVVLTSSPEGLKPGMSAELEILAGRDESVLVVPPQAVKPLDGRDVCYVVRPDGLPPEPRDVTVGRLAADRVEVVDGLDEGERVILADPSALAERGGLASLWPWN